MVLDIQALDPVLISFIASANAIAGFSEISMCA